MPEPILNQQELKKLRGLSLQEIAERRARDGWNELPGPKRHGFLSILGGVIREPMFLLLVVCGLFYLVMGEPRDALLLLGFVVVMMGITVIQEGKTERTLESLKQLSSPRALVIRDGERQTIPGRELVVDDLVVLFEGERVPADGSLLWSSSLRVDESLLTGESVPIDKQAPDLEGSLVDDRVSAGTLVVGGQAVMQVAAVGGATAMGRIGKALTELHEPPTPLQTETGRLVRVIFIAAVALCCLVVLIHGLTRLNPAGQADWLGGFLTGLTLAMAMLPEEFPVVLTIFLALGAWRISRKQVLARKMSAVETLGAATVLCSDKTGTITENRMGIRELWVEGQGSVEIEPHPAEATLPPLPESCHALVEWGVLASRTDPFDPMEKAFLSLLASPAVDGEHRHPEWELLREYPLSARLLSVTQVWRSGDADTLAVAVKGAPEAVMDLCHLPAERQASIMVQVGEMAAKGLRVLAVARGSRPASQSLPDEQHDFDFRLEGLVGLADPIRAGVPEAVRQCRAAGIRVVMITGDYPATAASIARQIGLEAPDRVITGAELESAGSMSARAGGIQESISHCQVFARVVPEQKLQLVQALQARGAVVAMTGDGVNDAPALKAAHIGVAMGLRGTDVAREASALVLMDDDFSSIVAAIRTGRRIFDNLKKAMSYIISVHVPIAGLTILPVMLVWKDPILLPVHIVFLELLIDPACSIVFEGQPEEAGIMDRPPRKRNEPILGASALLLSLGQGLTALACVAAVWLLAGRAGLEADVQRTLSFVALIVSNLAVILSNRSWSQDLISGFRSRNKAVPWVLGGALGFLALVIWVPALRELFHFGLPSLPWIGLACALGLASVSWFELLKLARRRAHRPVI